MRASKGPLQAGARTSIVVAPCAFSVMKSDCAITISPTQDGPIMRILSAMVTHYPVPDANHTFLPWSQCLHRIGQIMLLEGEVVEGRTERQVGARQEGA